MGHETILMIRHLTKADAEAIVEWVENQQDENMMEHACIMSKHRTFGPEDSCEVTMTW